MLTVGSFVWVDGFGTGRVADLPADGQTAAVRFFSSVTDHFEELIPIEELTAADPLPRKTTCWVREDGVWREGRIGQFIDGQYEVRLTGGGGGYRDPDEIDVPRVVTADRATGGAVDLLAGYSHTSPYLHDRRFDFVRMLAEMRAAWRGLFGLASSRVDLRPHQLEVARRVLEDPIQRYLLADEVGLGKTVEAGLILRQVLLDEPRATAVVIAPPLLVPQWRREMVEKFDLGGLGSHRVRFVADDEEWPLPGANLAMVIVDEAHHLAALGGAPAGSAGRQRFDDLVRLATASPRLLLLSATPVLNNEADFLAMLHLLDPTVYRLADLDAFRGRVRQRKPVGQALMSLRETGSKFVLKAQIKRLAELFPADDVLGRHLGDLTAALDDPAAKAAAVRAVRTHVSETYRLHRRLLRNRRQGTAVDLPDRCEPDRAADPVGRLAEHEIDDRAGHMADLLEAWRAAAVAAVGDGDPGPIVSVFRSLLEATGTWWGVLEATIGWRLGEAAHGPAVRYAFGPVAAADLDTVPLFDGEADLLAAMRSLLRRPAEANEDRIDLLRQYVLKLVRAGRASKVVVFTSFAATAVEVVRRVAATAGFARVAAHHAGLPRDEVERQVERFRADGQCVFLVCDRTGEEGRNLQFADGIVHFDLPLSPNRVEQRIGRLDRIGVADTVRTRLLLGGSAGEDASLQEAWAEVLGKGLNLFGASIADLQFCIDRDLGRWVTALFRHGPAGVDELVAEIRRGVTAERADLADQQILDEFDLRASADFARGAAAPERQAKQLRLDVERWVGEALLFRTAVRPGDDAVRRYEWTDRTLVPGDLVAQWSGGLGPFGTFDRSRAVDDPTLTLYRPGEPLVEAVSRLAYGDARGRAFALWRRLRTWPAGVGQEWTGFRFNFLIEADLTDVTAVLAAHGRGAADLRAVRRRADALFPPVLRPVFVNQGGQPPAAAVLDLLARPYTKRTEGGTDTTLDAERTPVLHQFIDPTQWRDRIDATRAAAEAAVRAEAEFVARGQARGDAAEAALSARCAQLSLRAGPGSTTADGGAADLALERDLAAALVAGVRRPRFLVDSVGFLVLSGREAPRDPAEVDD